MKNGMKLTLVAWLLGVQIAVAAESSKQEPQGYSRDEIKYALMVLITTGALQFPENQCPKVDEKLIEELRRDGVLQDSEPKLSTVCILISK